MKYGILPLVMIFLVSGLDAQSRKYDIKSGIITFETVMTLGETKAVETTVVTFDDYGMRERKDTYKDGALRSTYLSNGRDLIAINHAAKEAIIEGSAYRGTELRFDWNDIPERDKNNGTAKQLPAMTVAGKACEAYMTARPDSSTSNVFAGWSKIILYMEIKSNNLHSVMKAVQFEENKKIGAGKFDIPSGYSIRRR